MKTSTRPLSLKSVTSDAITAFSKERGEPDWVLSLRQYAFDNFARLPWPSAKDGRWKRSQLEKLEWDLLTFSPAPSTPGFSFALPDTLKDAPVEWISLDDAFKTKQDRLQAAWANSIENAKNNKFLSLTLALGNAGSCLIVPKGQVIKAPFQSQVLPAEKGASKFLLNFIFLDEAAEAQIWEELKGREDSEAVHNFVSSYTSITLKENAKANCYFLQNWDDKTAQLQFQSVAQGAFSKYNAIAVSMGGKLFHNETTVHLHGQGSENKVLGVLFGDQDQNFVNWVTQNHTAPRTTSDIQYRSALKGKSHSFFSGMVYISKEGQQSDAYQSAKALLLSKEARADAIPNLEILADDVKCSHGAAVGPVDEDQKFYLQTRGVPPEQAEEIIIQGFLEPVISEVPSQTVQDQLRNFVEKKIKTS